MAGDLTNETINTTYDNLLHLDISYNGLTSSYQRVYDGVGTAAPIRLKTNGVEITDLTVIGSLTFSGGLTLSDPLPVVSGGTGVTTVADYFASLWTYVNTLGTATAVSSDYVLISDTSDGSNPKRALISDLSTGGTITTGSNVGSGAGVFKGTSGSTLDFRSISSANTKLTVSLSGGTDVVITADSAKILDGAITTTGYVKRTGAETYTTVASASAVRSDIGLGTIATQDASGVSISGGAITGITDLAIADGGTGASTAQAAINALTAVSSATNEHVLTKDTATGNATWKVSSGGGGGAGLVDGDYGDVVVSGTGTVMTLDSSVVTTAAKTVLSQSSTANMLSTLGGQPLDTELTALAGLTSAADRVAYFTGSGTAALATFTSAGRSLVAGVDAAAQRTTLGLGTLATQSGTFSGTSSNTNTGDQYTFRYVAVSGQTTLDAGSTTATLTLAAGSGIGITTTVGTNTATISASGSQPLDATLTALAGTGTANTIPYFSASDTVTEAPITATGISLLGAANAAAVRTTLSLVPGTDVQAYDAELAALAGLTSAADALPYFTGAGTASTTTLTAAARTVLDDATVGAMLTTLGGQATDATLTALAAYNTNGILTQTAADTFTGRTITGTANQVTVSNGDGVSGNPTLSIPYNLNLGSSASGPSSIAFFEDTDNGANKVTVSAASSLASDVTFTLPATNGSKDQVLTTDGSGVTSWATASGGGGGLTFAYDTTTAITAAVNYDYLSNNAALCTVTLPGTAAQGSIIRVSGMGAGKVKILANTGDTIKGGSITTASGGYFYAQEQYSSLTLQCITADTTWLVIASVGNFAVDATS